jgi:DNA-binding NtrC family response regulator
VKSENVTVSPNPSSAGDTMLKILIVDDNLSTRRTTRIGLAMEGFQVDEAANVDQALEKLQTEPYDFVVTDVRMPLKSGLDLMVEGQSLRPAAKWILMSAYDFPVDEVKDHNLNPYGFLRKPFRIADLVKLIEGAA